MLQEFDDDGKLTVVLDDLNIARECRFRGPFVTDFLRSRFVAVIFLKFLAGSDPFFRSGALVDCNARGLVCVIYSSSRSSQLTQIMGSNIHFARLELLSRKRVSMVVQ